MNNVIFWAAISLFVLTGCDDDKWEGYAYPDRSNLTVHKFVGVFATLDECRVNSISLLNQISSLQKGDYECGLNCEYKKGYGELRICEKTVK